MQHAAPADGQGSLARTPDVAVVPLRVTIAASIDLGRVPAAFARGGLGWVAHPAGHVAAGLGKYVSHLKFGLLPEGGVAFRKAAIVGLGTPVRNGDDWVIPIEWRAASLAPLFPVLVGWLIARPAGLTIDGFYAPPFGRLGYVLDRGLLSIMARATARWFLGTAADALAARTPATA